VNDPLICGNDIGHDGQPVADPVGHGTAITVWIEVIVVKNGIDAMELIECASPSPVVLEPVRPTTLEQVFD
jgi:hypothetical protein